MQVDGKRKMEGLEPRIKNVHDAFVQIYREGGIKGLWRGSVVNVQRAALVSLGGFFIYIYPNYYLVNNLYVIRTKYLQI
jgi:solute carrier family 25 uncoupling protein 27